MNSLQIDQVLAQIRSYSNATAVKPQGLQGPGAAGNVGAAGATGKAGGVPDFGQLLKAGLDGVNATQQSATRVADAYERGAANVDLAQVMLESQKASVSFRALTEVRNRLVNVYQEIMNMPI